tara:strand:+ start:92 stop:850 length:759 start_codon:yes stop_codon:yes gene_type:complete
MTNEHKNNLLWIQFTPGSAGRSFLICCTTSDAVGDWIDNPLPDPIKFATERFCVVDSSEHMNNEPITPYDIKWYTRNAIFDRGDNLTKAQAHDYLLECKLSKKHYNENKLIANVWQKPHIPTWAKDEKIITICADEDSIPWLLERRRQVFYEWFEKEVHLLRYKPSKAPIGPHSKFYKPMQYVHEYTDADTFMRWDIKKEHVTSGPGLNIKLSDLLRGNLESIWDQVDEYLLQPINRQWCNKLMNTWRQRWV